QNFELLKAFIQRSKLTVCLDAHLEVDRAVPAFFDELFAPQQVEVHRFRRYAETRTLEIGVSEAAFVERVTECLERGEKVAIACRTLGAAQLWTQLFATYRPLLLSSETKHKVNFAK